MERAWGASIVPEDLDEETAPCHRLYARERHCGFVAANALDY